MIARRDAELPLAFALSLLAFFSLNALLGPRIDGARRDTGLDDELALYPSGRMLSQISCGYRNVVADYLWLRAIQYYGKHRKGDRIFDKAAHVFRVLTDLDPRFVEAYRFGALVVIEDAGEPEEGYRLLRKGIRENPDAWELCFDLGFHHFLNKEHEKAARYFQLASKYPGSDGRAARFAAFAGKKMGDLESSRRLWEGILETTGNDKYREAARFALKSIQAAEDTTYLAAGVRRYRNTYGSGPERLSDLTSARIVPRIPLDPFGGSYLIRPATGQVRSSYLLARDVKRDISVLEGVVRRFRKERNRYPADLEETVRRGYLDAVPSPMGAEYRLNRTTGEIDVFFDFLERAAGHARTGGRG